MSEPKEKDTLSRRLKQEFGKSEIAYLVERPSFRAVLASGRLNDYEGLRQTALNLLSERAAISQVPAAPRAQMSESA